MERNKTVNLVFAKYDGNPEPFWDTTMNPETRKIIQVTVEDAEMADQMLTLCMGSDIKDRKDFIIDNAINATVDV